MSRRSSVLAADLFCGAGGTSTGLTQACDVIGRRLRLSAVNHWQRAVETHAANHPSADHHCEDLTTLDPRKAVPGGKLDLLVASPECTHHSVARGGMPVNDQSRASAWCVLRWCTALRVDRVLIENVPEFETWGPIGANGRPLRSRKGETFRAFVGGLESLGYRVAWRVLNAADHGGATTRRRLFIQAARGRLPMRWPEATHEPDPTPGLFGLKQRWRAAREVIDWSIPGESIFTRKRPLSENTLRRIEAGIRKFCGQWAEPFLVLLRGTDRSQVHGSARSVDSPTPTFGTSGAHIGLCQPFVLSAGGPVVAGRSAGEPVPTVLTRDRLGLCEPFICKVTNQGDDNCRVKPVDIPLGTLTASNGYGLVSPFIVPTNYGERRGQSPRHHDIDQPLPTVVAGGVSHGLCEPFLVPFYANGQADSTNDPLRTVTTRDRHGLCEPDAVRLDIRFRMLQPHELAAAMGFPAGYRITGNRGEQVKQIGNAVEVNQARALCLAILDN